MSKVTTTQVEYVEFDKLDNIELKSNETLVILWPNGSLSQEIVQVETIVIPPQHEKSLYFHIRKSFINVQHRGVTTKVYLSGLDCRRLNNI